MKNLFKKILACCLVVCMVFTLCISAVTVSAEEATFDGTLTIGNAEVAAGAKEATVSFAALAEKDGIAAAEVNVTLPAGATGISKVELDTTDENVEVIFFQDATGDKPVTLPDISGEEDVLVYEGDVNIIENVFSYILWVNNNADVTTVATTVEITFVGDFNETAPVTAAIEACKDDVDLLKLDVVEGAINVTAAHTCTPAEAVKENEVAATCTTAGSYDLVVYCADTDCGKFISKETVTVDALGHAWVDGDITYTDCTSDGNKAQSCSRCDATQTVAVAPKGHTEVDNTDVPATCTTVGYTGGTHCDVCDAVIEAATEVPALGHKEVYTNNGDNHTVTCSNGCDMNVTEDHSFVDGTCDKCGAKQPVSGPVLDERLQFRDIAVSVTDTVNIRYRIYKNTTNGINGYATLGYDHIEVVVYGKEYSFVTGDTLYNEVDFPETTLVTETTNPGSNHFFNGIAMISLGLNINAYIKAYDADGNYVAYSPVTSTSPEAAIKKILADATTETAKATNIELLNMAAAAQIKFAADKSGTDLAAAVAAGKLVNNGVPESIVTDLPELTVASGEAVWADDVDANFQSDHKISAAVPINVSPGIRIYVGGKDSLDASQLKVEFTYYDPNPSVKDTVTKTVQGTDASVSGKRLAFNLPNLEFHNSNAIVTASVIYEGSVVATLDYSVETSIAEVLAEGSTSSKVVKDLNAAIAKFGLAFRMNKGIA